MVTLALLAKTNNGGNRCFCPEEFLPLVPKLLFGNALAHETPFHIIFVASVELPADASPLKRGLVDELQHWKCSSSASCSLDVEGELEIDDLE